VIRFRPAIAEDRPFIRSGFSASLRMSRDVPLIAMSDWADIMHPVIDRVLDRVSAIVAHGEVLQGFIAFEPGYVVYIYVAQPFRRNGIARGLFDAAGIDPGSRFDYACRTKASWECRHKYPLAEFNPYRIRFAP